jgi:hypothetical protein
MARPLRVNLPGLTYHVWANAISGARLYRDAHDKDVALRMLREEVRLSNWTCLMYVFMSTHYHLLLRLREATLSSGFLRFNLRYARYYNDRYEMRGHVFDGRFEHRIVEGETASSKSRVTSHSTRCKRTCAAGRRTIPGRRTARSSGAIRRTQSSISRPRSHRSGGSRRAYRSYVEEPDARKRWGQVRARPQKARSLATRR